MRTRSRDPFAPDRIRVEFAVDETGDREVLELVETGASTGVFTGYLGSGEGAEAAGNCAIGTGPIPMWSRPIPTPTTATTSAGLIW
ncbi:MAG: hypothetical protein U5R48_08065 [Gammaproteobacteria bacterium]|nr:hypothetical protein [Gammaproteobacteria bacterium]